MSEYTALYDQGSAVTLVAGAGGVTGGQLVTSDGVAATDAAVGVAGVAKFDAPAGQPFGIYREGIHRATAVGAIANKDPLCAAAGGIRKWVTGTDPVASRIGTAWSTAANGATVTYALIGV